MSKKPKTKVHVTYNHKRFLAPNSINSMAMVFTKIYKTGIAIIRISDCNKTIKLWNDLNDKKQVSEMLEKIDNLQQALVALRAEVVLKNEHIIN